MKALFLALALTLPITATAQNQEGYKSPGTATIIGVVVPGGGQLYVGDMNKGMTLLGASVGGVVATVAGASTGNTALTLAGLGVEVGSWIYGFATAGSDARKHNETIHVSLILPPKRAGIGLSLQF